MSSPSLALARGAAVALCIATSACASTSVKTTPGDLDGLEGMVRVEERRPSQWGTETEVARVLYDPTACPGISGRRVEREDDTSCHKSLYHVSKGATIHVDFNPAGLIHLKGGVRVRARLLGDNPVELPVENYGRISKDQLQVGDPMTLDDNRSRIATWAKTIPLAAARDAFVTLNTADGVLEHADSELAASYRDFQRLGDAAKEAALPRLQTRADTRGAPLDRVAQATRATRDAVDKVFDELHGMLAAAGLPDYDRGAAAAARRKLERGLLAAKERSSQDAVLARAVAACVSEFKPKAEPETETGPTLTAKKLEVCVKRHAADTRSTALLSQEQSAAAVDEALDELEAVLARAAEDALDGGIKPARIYLAAASTEHGDVLEVIVEEIKTASPDKSEGAPPTVAAASERVMETLRFRLRLVDNGVSARIAPQFVLLRRFKDVAVASATAKPTNFEVTPGASLTFRWRSLDPITDWFIPSLGIHAALPDFDPSNTGFELGVGFAVGLLNELVHFGFGWNLHATRDHEYFFISLDFLAGIDGFTHLTKSEGDQ